MRSYVLPHSYVLQNLYERSYVRSYVLPNLHVLQNLYERLYVRLSVLPNLFVRPYVRSSGGSITKIYI